MTSNEARRAIETLCCFPSEIMTEQRKDAFKLAIEALKKDTSYLPIIRIIDYTDEFFCPTCDYYLEYYPTHKPKRCPECGQLLKHYKR